MVARVAPRNGPSRGTTPPTGIPVPLSPTVFWGNQHQAACRMAWHPQGPIHPSPSPVPLQVVRPAPTPSPGGGAVPRPVVARGGRVEWWGPCGCQAGTTPQLSGREHLVPRAILIVRQTLQVCPIPACLPTNRGAQPPLHSNPLAGTPTRSSSEHTPERSIPRGRPLPYQADQGLVCYHLENPDTTRQS